MRLTWSLPRKPMSSAHRLSYPSMRKGWRGIPTPRRMMTKKMTRINSPEYQPLSHLTVGFRWGKKEIYLSWHRRGGLRRCPLKSQYSFCALQQPKCFKAAPCCIVCTPIPVEGKEGQCFKATHSELCWEKQRAFYEGQNLQNGMWESKRYCRSSKSISTTHSLLPNSVNSAFLQRSMYVVFGYFWCIIWGGRDGVGKKGDGLESFLLKFGACWGEMVKERKEQLMMIWFCVQNISSFQKMSLAT